MAAMSFCTPQPLAQRLLLRPAHRLLARRALASTYKRSVETHFDQTWRRLEEQQRLVVEAEYAPLNAGDWRSLTLDQKRALYTISYGPPIHKDPYEGWKIAGSVAALIGVTGIVYYVIRSFAKPPPKTLSPEYKEKEREYLRAQNANPILGLSSVKKDPRAERDDDS